MAKARRMRIGIARTPTKHREKDIISKAKHLEKHPELIVPQCSPEHCGKGHFTKTLKAMEKIQKIKDDEFKLKKATMKGDRLARAFAVSLQIARTESIPVLAAAKFEGLGEFSYVMFRSATDKRKLVGVQYNDRADVRLLAVAEEVKRKGLHIYSDRNGMYCTGRLPAPSKEFVRWTIKQIKGLPADGVCRHITEDIARERGPATNGEPYFRLHWRSADYVIAVCSRCTGERHSFAELGRFMAAPDIKADFEAEAVIRLVPEGKIEEADLMDYYGRDPEAEKEYLSGSINLSDGKLIQRHQEVLDRRIMESGEKVFVLDNRFFGDNYIAFVEALTVDPLERGALENALDSYDKPLVVHDTTPGKVMQILWEECGYQMLMSAAEDKEIARMVLDNCDLTKDTPTKLLKDAQHLARHSRVLSKLPVYGKLPPAAALADRLARIYLTEDVNAVIRELEKDMSRETNVMAYAFLVTLGKETGKEWHFTKEDRDFGTVLQDYVKALLAADDGKDFHAALEALHQASGGVGELERQD